MSTTTAANPSKNGDQDTHWDLTRQHGHDISELKAGQARLEVGLSHVSNSLDSNFASLRQSLAERTQPQPPTPWVPIASLVISVIIMIGAGVMMKVTPIENGMIRNRAEINANQDVLIDRAYDMGRYETSNKQLQADAFEQNRLHITLTEDISQLRERASSAEAKLKLLGDYVKTIDALGTRSCITAGNINCE